MPPTTGGETPDFYGQRPRVSHAETGPSSIPETQSAACCAAKRADGTPASENTITLSTRRAARCAHGSASGGNATWPCDHDRQLRRHERASTRGPIPSTSRLAPLNIVAAAAEGHSLKKSVNNPTRRAVGGTTRHLTIHGQPNKGPTPEGVVVNDLVPAGLTLSWPRPSQGTYKPGHGEVGDRKHGPNGASATSSPEGQGVMWVRGVCWLNLTTKGTDTAATPRRQLMRISNPRQQHRHGQSVPGRNLPGPPQQRRAQGGHEGAWPHSVREMGWGGWCDPARIVLVVVVVRGVITAGGPKRRKG